MKKNLLKTALISTLAISFLLAGCGAREATSPAVANAHTYVGSSSSDKYHYPSCTAAKKIKEANQVWFSDASEAQGDGYRPCKVCKPPS